MPTFLKIKKTCKSTKICKKFPILVFVVASFENLAKSLYYTIIQLILFQHFFDLNGPFLLN